MRNYVLPGGDERQKEVVVKALKRLRTNMADTTVQCKYTVTSERINSKQCVTTCRVIMARRSPRVHSTPGGERKVMKVQVEA